MFAASNNSSMCWPPGASPAGSAGDTARSASHNDPDIHQLVREFNAHYDLVTRSFETQEQLNANGHFVLALHARLEERHDAAIGHFERAQAG